MQSNIVSLQSVEFLTEFGTLSAHLQNQYSQFVWPLEFFGAPFFESFNRSVFMFGSAFTAYGGNSPIVYHYPYGLYLSGAVACQFGHAWISCFSRSVGMLGLDSSAVFADNLSERMRVQNFTRKLKIHGGNYFGRFGTHSLCFR